MFIYACIYTPSYEHCTCQETRISFCVLTCTRASFPVRKTHHLAGFLVKKLSKKDSPNRLASVEIQFRDKFSVSTFQGEFKFHRLKAMQRNFIVYIFMIFMIIYIY